MDASTKMPALKNPVLSPGALSSDALLPALQARGALILLCNNSIIRISRTLSAGGYGSVEALRGELLRTYLLPGIIVVPAMVVAANRLQARGLSYVSS